VLRRVILVALMESVDENQNVANDHVMTENISTDFVYLEQE
jgi:hypothetical protein